VGKLSRRLELTVDSGQLNGFLDELQRRLGALGFYSTDQQGIYEQKGPQTGTMHAYTHAKTRKQLEVYADESAGTGARVTLVVRYLELIVGDTGESAYADAVMAYASGQADTMQTVANRNSMAFSTLVFGGFTWAVLLGLKVLNIEPFLGPILVLGGTTVASGVLAIITISSKPKELSGMWLAVIGMVAGGLAVVAAGVIAFLSHVIA
jgi:hypothetical protein